MRLGILALIVPLIGTAAFGQVAANFVNNSVDNEFAWFEQGVYPGSNLLGLPPAGIVHGESDPASTFLLQPYTSNNVLIIQPSVPNVPGVQTGRMTLSTPTPAESLAIATASGFGPNGVSVVVHFSDGTPDVPVQMSSRDWLTGAFLNKVTTMNGRISLAGRLDNPNSYQLAQGGFRLMEEILQLGLADPHPVSSLDFTWVSTGSIDNTPYHKAAIFGISTSLGTSGPYTAAPLDPSSFNADIVVEASAVPEPAAGGLLLAAAIVSRRFRIAK